MGTRTAHRIPRKLGRAGRNGVSATGDDGTRTGIALNHASLPNGLHASGGALAFPLPVELPAAERPERERTEKAASAPATPHRDSQEFKAFSDAELLRHFAHSRDERAFAELYERHKSEIYTYCLRMMSGDCDKASDIFQEVFIRAFERAEQFRNGTNVGGWLYTIARNQCFNTHRNPHPAERLDASDSPIGLLPSTDRSLAPEYDEEQHFLRRKLEEALARLPL